MNDVEITQDDIDLQHALWKMSVNWGNTEHMQQMIADHRYAAEWRITAEYEEETGRLHIEIARLRQALADIANGLSFLSNPVDLALAQYTKDIRTMAKKALAIQPGDTA